MKTLLNRVLVTVLVLSLLMSSSAQLFATPAIAADEDFQDMKIGVMSDVHFQTAAGCTAESTVPTMLEQFKADNVDVIMLTGDVGYACEDLEYEKFWNAWNSVFPDEETAPELFVISGNHEYDRVVFGKEELQVAQERFMKVFGLDEMNQHIVVNGYHFIGINSEDGSTHGKYTEVTTDWLKQQLDAAVADNPNMPIFVTAHQPLLNTTYGSEWGGSKTGALYEVLKDYPQVVYFAGHSHYASESERSIFQEFFTCVDVTSLNYMSLEDGNHGYQSQGALLVTVNGADKQIVIDRYKINHAEEGDSVVKIKEPWVLNLPLNPDEFTYTNARAEARTAPTFAEGSALTVSDVTFATAKVAFPTATHDDYVHNYNIRVKQGDTVVMEKLVNGDFYQPAEKQKAIWTVPVEGLEPDTTYTVEVTAEESFGKESQPLVAEFTTKPPLDKTQFNDPMDNWDLIEDKHEKWQKETNKEIGKTLFSKTDNTQDVWMVWKFDGYIRDFNLDLVIANGFGGTIGEMEIYVSKDGIDWKQLCLKASDLVADPSYADPTAAYWMNSTVSNNLNMHYRKANIPKKNGDFRNLSVPDAVLKTIQKRIAEVLLIHMPISKYAKAYRFGGSTLRNAKHHVGKQVVLKLDILHFFDSIRYSTVKDVVFPEKIYAEPLRILLTMLCYHKDALPQGAPSSPAITNIILYEFDEQIGGWCQEQGIAYTRYCDDMTFSGDFDPAEVIRYVGVKLEGMGFLLNAQKTRIQHIGQRQTVTGIVVNEKLSIPTDYRRKLRQELYYCRKYGIREHLQKIGLEMPEDTYRMQLLGKVDYVLQLHPNDQDIRTAKKWLQSNMMR